MPASTPFTHAAVSRYSVYTYLFVMSSALRPSFSMLVTVGMEAMFFSKMSKVSSEQKGKICAHRKRRCLKHV